MQIFGEIVFIKPQNLNLLGFGSQSQTSLQQITSVISWICNRIVFFKCHMIRCNFDQGGGISSCISGELRPNVKRTHSTKGKAKEWHPKPVTAWCFQKKTQYELFQHKRGIKSQLSTNSVNPTKVLYFRRPNWSFDQKENSFHCLPRLPFGWDQHFAVPFNCQQVPFLHVTVSDHDNEVMLNVLRCRLTY